MTSLSLRVASSRVDTPAQTSSPVSMLDALARAMAARDGLTHQHAERVQGYAAVLARQCGLSDQTTLRAISAAALLHDVGKLGIADRVLHKPGPLTAEEYDEVKRHPVIGADILAGIAYPGPLALFVRHHHENWDGSGYPDGLLREAIPVGARVLAVVDCYDALTSNRPYRRALGHESAVAMIFERRGTMYDPDITDAFLKVVWGLRSATVAERTRKQYAHLRLERSQEASAR